tara:strand:+ start:3486 stop:4616 length:1131 start_codon:yes stop_codon:yes gene_type:complete
MATTFKTLTANDIVNTRTLLHEAIPLTGTIASGTYADQNVKEYSHGMFTSVYDYPYLSSSANHIFDIATGFSANSDLSGNCVSDGSVQISKKINIYNQMAQVLMGYDANGSIQEFDEDGDLASGGTKMQEVFFINFARLLGKDEIKKGSFTAQFVTGGIPSAFGAATGYSINGGNVLTLGDYGANTSYLVNSPAGEYAALYTSSAAANSKSGYGLLFYQAGIAVVTGAIWSNPLRNFKSGSAQVSTGMGEGVLSASFENLLTSSAGTLDYINNSIRNRIASISFNNTVELNSTIYFCRANHNEFNYSSNPTYLEGSSDTNPGKLRVKNATSDQPVSYITTIGLYSSDNELLAVAKLSEPLKKDPNTELTLRVRLDY